MELGPGAYKPGWWDVSHDTLLAQSIMGRNVFRVILFKAELEGMLRETLPNYVNKEKYDFDLDFIVSRVQYISGMKRSRSEAEKLVLNDNYIRVEHNEQATFDAICEKCFIRHNVYINIQTYGREKCGMYSNVRTGCCGRDQVLMLAVRPWISIERFLPGEPLSRISISEADVPGTSHKERLRSMPEARHDTFMNWHQSIVNAEMSTDPQELMVIADETHRFYNELRSSGGISIWRTDKCLSPEIFGKDVDSPASTTSESFGLGDRIGSFAISSEGSSVTDEEIGEEGELSSRLSLDDD